MSVADKLLQIDQVKQDIKTAIEMKGIPMTNVAFTEYANKILDISGGGDFPTISYDEIEYFGWSYYMFSRSNVIEQIPQAWQDMKDSETVLFDIPLALVAPNQEMGGMTIDLYVDVGTDGQLQALYDACVNETIPAPISSNNRDVYYVNNVATFYAGDISVDVGFPIPLYMFGLFGDDDDTSFIVGDLTPLSMGLGLILAKVVNVSIPNNNIVIQRGFEFENENGIIISDSVTSIGERAFYGWTSNNQPLVIPDSVTLIGEDAFYGWSSNNQPLVIPDSVTLIGEDAFYGWTSNNQPLVIPDSVTSIGIAAFQDWSLVPYVEIQAITPPTLASDSAFGYQNNAPIYVPDESVDAYKTATNWVGLADRIFPINGNYVRFVSAEARTITPKYTNSGVTLQYSVDSGATWTTISSGASTTSATEHWFRGEATGTKALFVTNNNSNAWAFSGSSDLEVYGNLNFLLCDTLGDKIAPTTLAEKCYSYMFRSCTSLITAPELPATTLASDCYYAMFQLCTSLITAPELPATTLESSCYTYMFWGCTSLTKAPELPATTLTVYCYDAMFRDCSSLTTTPELPATTLADYCYISMFRGCTSLITAPELPATTLASGCYQYMFNGCTAFKVSETNTGSYTYAWRIPTSGTGVINSWWNTSMLNGTGGTFTSDPTIDTTYYVENEPV